MKSKHTELVFVLDRSGSMHGLEQDTIGGFNSLIQENKKVQGSCQVSTILFDHEIQLLHDRLSIRHINELNEKDYFVRGSTALYDAVGYGITKIKNVQKHQKCQVMMVIMTDGYENSSKEYSGLHIKKLIEQQKKFGWEFIFLGANLDVKAMAHEFGIDQSRARNFHADKQGVNLNYSVMNEVIKHYRQESTVNIDKLNEIDRDYQSRKKGNSN